MRDAQQIFLGRSKQRREQLNELVDLAGLGCADRLRDWAAKMEQNNWVLSKDLLNPCVQDLQGLQYLIRSSTEAASLPAKAKLFETVGGKQREAA
jgi:hypothetical protein